MQPPPSPYGQQPAQNPYGQPGVPYDQQPTAIYGQPASPTTLGKEMANVVARLKRAREEIGDADAVKKWKLSV